MQLFGLSVFDVRFVIFCTAECGRRYFSCYYLRDTSTISATSRHLSYHLLFADYNTVKCIINPRAINTITWLNPCLRSTSIPKTTSIIKTETEIVGPAYCNPPPTALIFLLRTKVLHEQKPTYGLTLRIHIHICRRLEERT